MKMKGNTVGCVVALASLVAFAEKGDEYIADKGDGVYEVNATSGLGLANFSDSWATRFLKSTDTFIFKGADGKGMMLDYKTPIATRPYTNQLSHIVFDGGEQTYGWFPSYQINATSLRLAAGSTRENPAIKVKSGTFLNFFNRTNREGSNAGADLGAWIEVEDGATLSLTNDVTFSGTYSYYLFPTVVHPGATVQLNFSSKASFRSAFVPDVLFYVPATTVGDMRVAHLDVKGYWVNLCMPPLGKPGFGLDVGENATLEFTGRVCGETDGLYVPFCKYGAGTLSWKGMSDNESRHFATRVQAGKLIYQPAGGYLSTGLKAEVSSGATLEIPSGNAYAKGCVTELYNEGTFRVTGTETVTLWNSRKVGMVETPDGAIVKYARTINPCDGRVRRTDEDLSRLTLYDSGKNTYAVKYADADYIYWDFVEELSSDAALTGVHSLKAVNPTPGIPRTIVATASDYAIEGRYVTIDVAANTTLALDAPLSGALKGLSGAGDFVVRVEGELRVFAADGFTGHLTVKGGEIVLPLSFAGNVTAEEGARIVYASQADQSVYSTAFTVNGYKGASTLKDFPVLVRLSESRIPGFRYEDCHESGSDLVFYAPDSDVEYPCDIETWNPNGESYVWVRLPELRAGTVFRLCYGGPERTLAATDTWRRPNGEDLRGGYAAVWHMASPTGTSVPDASGNGMDAGVYISSSRNDFTSPAVSDGAIGIARRVSDKIEDGGSKLRVPKATYDGLGLGDVFTASVWLRTEEVGDGSPSGDPRIFSCKEGSYAAGWEIEVVDNTAKFNMRSGTTSFAQFSMPIYQAGVWSYFTFVYDGTTFSAYENGVLVGTKTISAPASAPSVSYFTLGGSGNASINGCLDEARLLYGAASADWIAADYAVQAQEDFLASSGIVVMTAVAEDVFSDELTVAGRCALSNEVGTVTVELLDARSAIVDTKELAVTPGGVDYRVTFGGLTPESDYVVRLTLSTSDGGDALSVRELGVKTAKRYALVGNDAEGQSSLVDAGGHENNWTNVLDGSVLQYPNETCDYVAERMLVRTPEGAAFPENSVVRFAGRRLTVVGKDNDAIPDDCGTLALRHHNFTMAFDRLVLKSGGSVTQSKGGSVSPIEACIEIPEGETGYLEVPGDYGSMFNHLYGSMVGSGTVVLRSRSEVNLGNGACFYNDWSAFSGKVMSVRGGTYHLLGDFVPAGDCTTLTTDALKLDLANTVYVDKDVALTAANRGLTLASTGTLGIKVANSRTLKLAYPLYGSGAIKVLEESGYSDATIELCGARGDWSGTFSMANGTLVLAGLKPLGEGTLAVSGTGKVELDTAAVSGGICYLKAAQVGTRIDVKGLPSLTSEMKDFPVLSTEVTGGVTRDQLVLPALPDGVSLHSRVEGGIRTFSIGPKYGTVLIVR